jgi:predicted small lipoprotein YifL
MYRMGVKQKMRYYRKRAWTVAFIAAFFVMLVMASCGKKGPPVPPHAQELPPVTDLSYTLTGDTLTLVWKTPSGPAAKEIGRASCRERVS